MLSIPAKQLNQLQYNNSDIIITTTFDNTDFKRNYHKGYIKKQIHVSSHLQYLVQRESVKMASKISFVSLLLVMLVALWESKLSSSEEGSEIYNNWLTKNKQRKIGK